MRSLTQPWRIVNRNQRRSSRPRTRSLEREPKAIEVDLGTPVEYALNVKLRIVVAGARGLPLKEKTSGSSVDTFAVLSCGGSIQQTQVIKNSIAPEWNTTFEIPLTKISPRRLASGLLVTVFDKDRFRSSFIGRLHLNFNDFFNGTLQESVPIAFHDPKNEPKWYPLKDRSVRRTRYLRRIKSVESDAINGEICLKYGLVDAHGWQGTRSRQEWQEFWVSLLQRTNTPTGKPKAAARRMERRFSSRLSTSAPEAKIIIPGSATPIPNNALSYSEHGTPTIGGSPAISTERKKKRLRRRRRRGRSRRGSVVKFYGPDVMGVMFVEVSNAKDLPPERNVIRTGFDMDPFVVLSFGRHTFRTRAIRHNLNPVWNEKLFFHVRHSELKYNLKFAIYDKDKFSGNDFVAWQEMPVVDIISKSMSHAIEVNQATTNEQDPQDMIEKEMDTHTIDLKMANRAKWEGKHNPRLSFRAKFLPYTTIRKMFFMALAKPYDLEGNGMMNRLGVQSMLESLGSNITEATVNGFWERWKKSPETDDLTIEELIECLEEHLLRDHKLSRQRSHTAMVNDDYFSRPTRDYNALPGAYHDLPGVFNDLPGTSDDSPAFSSDGGVFSDGPILSDGEMFTGLSDFEELSTNLTGPLFNYDRFIDSLQDSEMSGEDEVDDTDDDEIDDEPLADANGVQLGDYSPSGPLTGSDDSQSLKSVSRDSIEEKVIRVTECPVCHRPNLARKRQMDIITHIATCAANDWTTVDRFLMGNFVTEAYAQRKWFVKLVSKVGYGRYSLGTNNANIIVQDRRTGQLIEERMSVYVRLGMRLLYKGMKTSVQSKRAQRILLNMTMRQGRRFDSTKSAREIPSFITFHKLDMSEVRDPLHSFKTFNQFFYRKLRVGARPCTNPNDPKTIVSPADCRMLAFPTINDATRVWIKGINFSVGKLLGDPEMGKRYDGGGLAVFRLAPQDYHRFHSPVDGVVSAAKYISGQFYTVNPMAIRTTLDVFGENARSVVFIDSPEFGRVAMVCIGAMMVGSIVITAKPGSTVKRTDEVGYFAFGGSTLVCIWPPNTTQFDQDLVDNSATALESLYFHPSSVLIMFDNWTNVVAALVGLAISYLAVTFAFQPKVVRFTVTPPAESNPAWKDGKIMDKPTIRDPKDPKTIICYDPATGRHLASIPAPTAADVAEAYQKASRAQEKWAQTSWEQRRAVLRSLLDFVLQNQEEICRVACRDTGKTMIDATLGEIITTCAKLRWTIDNGEEVLAQDYRAPGLLMMYKHAKVVYQPMGVVAALVSWNYPFHNTFGPLISALMSGNGIMIKCSEYVAWSTEYWQNIIHTCLAAHGHDPELVQFVNGFADVGEAIVSSGVNHITFIGSPQVGKMVQLNAAQHLVPCLLELGGKDCAILLKDADLGQAIPVLMRGVFQNCGQNCIGIERILVAQEIYDGFVAEMERRIKTLRLGSALEDGDGIDCGAMTMGTQSDRLEHLIQEAVSRGARLLLGGKRYQHPEHPTGQYFSPTLLVDVTPDMEIANHETFAPIMVIMKHTGADDALRLANLCPYGLGSSVFSADKQLAEEMCLKLKVGMANVNDFAVNYLCQSLPFGGVGISGYGRFAGAEGLRGLCVPKSITIDRIPFVKTPIPPIVDYPIKSARKGYGFVKELVRFAYGPALSEKIAAGLGLAKASM